MWTCCEFFPTLLLKLTWDCNLCFCGINPPPLEPSCTLFTSPRPGPLRQRIVCAAGVEMKPWTCSFIQIYTKAEWVAALLVEICLIALVQPCRSNQPPASQRMTHDKQSMFAEVMFAFPFPAVQGVESYWGSFDQPHQLAQAGGNAVWPSGRWNNHSNHWCTHFVGVPACPCRR